MLIDKSMKISEVQEAFMQAFPGLRLEFYLGAHAEGRPSPARQQLASSLLIADVPGSHATGDLTIAEGMTVAELEATLQHQFGLNAQVFRRSGNLWLQTSATDQWTLAEQNRKGCHSEELFKQRLED
jgi:hypothetical protein